MPLKSKAIVIFINFTTRTVMIYQILWLASLPVMIFFSYIMILWALKRFENRIKD